MAYDEVYKRVQKEIKIDDSDIQSRIVSWLTKGSDQKATSGKIRLSEELYSNYKTDARDIVERYFDRGDLSGLKRETFNDDNLNEIKDNQFYNLAYYQYRQARDSQDVPSLERIKDLVRGTSVEKDIVPDIERAIGRIRK